VGITWDPYGTGKTAIRIGAGQFFQREEVGLAEGMAFNAPFELGISTNRSLDAPSPISSATVLPSYGKTTNGKLANSWQYNVSIEQEVARNTTLQVGYVGNAGLHLTDQRDVNPVPNTNWLAGSFTSGNLAPLRPAFNFGSIGGFKRGGQANYNSLQALFKAQTGAYSTFQAAYTWSHSIGNVELDNSSGSLNQEAITNQADPGLDKGNTNINRPNIFVANEVFFLPKFASHGMLVQNTLGGWEVNSIVAAAQGSSLTILTNSISGATVNGTNSFLSALVGTGYEGNLRPLASGQITCNQSRNGDQILNINHFSLVGYPIGTFPSNLSPRGSCFGAPNTNVDSQLAKNWYVKERLRIKFSMDFFNLFNHANFNSGNLEGSAFNPATPVYCGGASKTNTAPGPCSPTNNVITADSDPGTNPNYITTGFGQASTVHFGRQLQYTLRFSF
jgi:hypothetical protein